jgi:hypothetical protein
MCSSPTTKMDGAVCDPGTKCVMNAACMGGTCAGLMVTCTPMDECHLAGMCDPTTGTCSNPERADGATCSIGACVKGVCQPATVSSSVGAGGGATTGAGSGTGGSSKGSSGGCHCGFRGEPVSGGLWLGLLAALALARRRAAV